MGTDSNGLCVLERYSHTQLVMYGNWSGKIGINNNIEQKKVLCICQADLDQISSDVLLTQSAICSRFLRYPGQLSC